MIRHLLYTITTNQVLFTMYPHHYYYYYSSLGKSSSDSVS